MTQDQSPPKRGRGRPPVGPGQDTQPVNIRLTAEQREKLAKLGGPPWVRDKIDRAKLPTK